MNITPVQIAAEPISIPLSSQTPEQAAENARLLLYFTGYTIDLIKALSDTHQLPLRRTSGGRGSRYVLFLHDFRRWLERLPRD